MLGIIMLPFFLLVLGRLGLALNLISPEGVLNPWMVGVLAYLLGLFGCFLVLAGVELRAVRPSPDTDPSRRTTNRAGIGLILVSVVCVVVFGGELLALILFPPGSLDLLRFGEGILAALVFGPPLIAAVTFVWGGALLNQRGRANEHRRPEHTSGPLKSPTREPGD